MVNKTSSFKTKLIGNVAKVSRVNHSTLLCLTFPHSGLQTSHYKLVLSEFWAEELAPSLTFTQFPSNLYVRSKVLEGTGSYKNMFTKWQKHSWNDPVRMFLLLRDRRRTTWCCLETVLTRMMPASQCGSLIDRTTQPLPRPSGINL